LEAMSGGVSDIGDFGKSSSRTAEVIQSRID
jgi:hypothetical protein